MMFTAHNNVVTVHPASVAAFNKRWPCSPLNADKAYTFTFSGGCLVDTNVNEDEDGDAALALCGDAEQFLAHGVAPDYAAKGE